MVLVLPGGLLSFGAAWKARYFVTWRKPGSRAALPPGSPRHGGELAQAGVTPPIRCPEEHPDMGGSMAREVHDGSFWLPLLHVPTEIVCS